MARAKQRCHWCGKEFWDYPSNHRRFCGRECYVQFWRKEVVAKVKATKAKARVTITCPECGKVFADAQSNRRVYCSKACSDKHTLIKGVSVANDRNCNWKGEEASYSAKHLWIKWRYGNPERCEFCGVEGRLSKGHWTIHWANISGKYLRDRSDYHGLCRKCHHHFDSHREEYHAQPQPQPATA